MFPNRIMQQFEKSDTSADVILASYLRATPKSQIQPAAALRLGVGVIKGNCTVDGLTANTIYRWLFVETKTKTDLIIYLSFNQKTGGM